MLFVIFSRLKFSTDPFTAHTSGQGLEFEECYATKVEVDIQGLHIYLIDIESLKKNKRETGRLQDLADAENLS